MKGKKFGIIVIDNPWEYNNKNTGGSMTSGSKSKYPTLSLKELKDLPITDLCDPDNGSYVFVWAPTPLLPEALELVQAWGLKYRTTITWVKTGRLGMGYHFRVNTEHVLVCTWREPPVLKSSQRNHFSATPTTHSTKPDDFYKIINQVVKKSPLVNKSKIDIFARKRRKGWSSIGLDIDKKDIRDWFQLIGGTKPLSAFTGE